MPRKASTTSPAYAKRMDALESKIDTLADALLAGQTQASPQATKSGTAKAAKQAAKKVTAEDNPANWTVRQSEKYPAYTEYVTPAGKVKGRIRTDVREHFRNVA